MFTDPLAMTMAMQMLFFVGLIVVFFFLARAMAAQGEETRESLRKQQMFLADLERQFMEMSFLLRQRQGSKEGDPPVDRVRTRDDLAPAGQKDGFLPMPSRKAGDRASDDLLLPPPIPSRAPAENYDPEKDPFLFDDGFAPAPARDAYAWTTPADDGSRDGGLRLPPTRRDAKR
jgi:hypothetical protein